MQFLISSFFYERNIRAIVHLQNRCVNYEVLVHHNKLLLTKNLKFGPGDVRVAEFSGPVKRMSNVVSE